jgi:large subunit ribosomal protein L23
MIAMQDEKLYKVLLSARLTEKGTQLEKHRQYIFRVCNDATKTQVKQAVEKLFGVSVEAVRVCNVRSKVKKFGQIMGKRQGWKKAYVMLKEGQVLKLAGA